MMKIALGLITALMLAACAFTPTTGAKVADSGTGHPDSTYPGPRAY
ncbi:MAG TPA: hypothetical protein VG308_19790 [Stellaceae bacterium]|jgi:hypothetical protein|nr:hypothetical protein [Stellaceae bacterium]